MAPPPAPEANPASLESDKPPFRITSGQLPDSLMGDIAGGADASPPVQSADPRVAAAGPSAPPAAAAHAATGPSSPNKPRTAPATPAAEAKLYFRDEHGARALPRVLPAFPL